MKNDIKRASSNGLLHSKTKAALIGVGLFLSSACVKGVEPGFPEGAPGPLPSAPTDPYPQLKKGVEQLFASIVVKGKGHKLEALGEAAAEEGSATAINLYGQAALHTGELKHLAKGGELIEESLPFVLEAAGSPGEAGKDQRAQLCIGLSYLWGHGVEQNYEVAAKWLHPLRNTMPLVQRLLDAAEREEAGEAKAEEEIEEEQPA